MNRKEVYEIDCEIKKQILALKAVVAHRLNKIYNLMEKLTVNGVTQKIAEENENAKR